MFSIPDQSTLQREIVQALAMIENRAVPTSAIIDAVGRPRDPVGYASVSRALRRLVARGHVITYRDSPSLRGPGSVYQLAASTG